jgi:FKBP-type peptidyl-prolyl cis-trans isomerase SlyD|tara:strand:+ start:100 stop:639 length:540 start_codon:yes stop_codon:yes gene_type:complete
MNEVTKEFVSQGKFVELKYKVIDSKSKVILTSVEYPIGYIHGVTEALAPQVTAALTGKVVGDIIDAPIDCNKLYGPRDESLVFTDNIDNVPEQYREVGMNILMESEQGQTKSFLVTRVDEKSVTIDGNNPLCGREVIFRLEILTVREATQEEIEVGGPIDAEPDISEIVGKDQRVEPIN